MSLDQLVFKTEKHKELFKILSNDGYEASIHELSKMSGLAYATAHGFVKKLEKLGLVKITLSGRSHVVSLNAKDNRVRAFLDLLVVEPKKKEVDMSEVLKAMPLVGDFSELDNVSAETKEELLVKLLKLAKQNSTILRSLPLILNKLGSDLDLERLQYWEKRFNVGRELGFVLDLTSKLTGNKKYKSYALSFMDQRWSQPKSFFLSDEGAKGYREILIRQNTPDLAKKWFLQMNMGLDSFKSHYSKFA